MLIFTIIALSIGQGGVAATSPRVIAPILDYKSGVFSIKSGTETQRVMLKRSTPVLPSTVTLKSGKNSASWNGKSLNLKFGSAITKGLKLGDALTSPKLFSSEKIAQISARIASGEITRNVSGLSGWSQSGANAYFLVRFDNKSKKPWLECLFKVNLAAKTGNFQPIGAFESITGTIKKGDQKLIPTLGGFAIIGKKDGEWGVDFLANGSKSSSFTPVGSNYPEFQILNQGREATFVEKTTYGTYLAGKVTIPAGIPSFLAESKNQISFPGPFSSIAQIVSADKNVIRNTISGLELELPKNIGVVTTSRGVLVWTPSQEPRTAILYDTIALRSLVRWNAPKLEPARVPSNSRNP